MKNLIRLLLPFFLFISFFSCQNSKYRNMELYPIMEKGLYGFIDTLGNIIVVPQYLCVSNFRNHLAVAIVDTFYDFHSDSTYYKLGLDYAKEVNKMRYLNIRYGYIDIENEFIIAPKLIRRYQVGKDFFADEYDLENISSALVFNEGLAMYQDTNTYLYGYIDTLGQQRIPAQYYLGREFSSGKAAVQIFECNDEEPVSDACFKWGYIDSQGHKKSEFIYYALTSCINGRSFGKIYSMAKDQERLPVIGHNEKGEIEFKDPDYMEDMPIQSIVTVLLDENGNIINNDLPSVYNYYDFSRDGIAVAERQGAEIFGPDYKFLDKNGNFLIPRDINNFNKLSLGPLPDEHYFSNVTAMSEGYAGVMGNDDNWLFVDKNLNLYAPINDIDYEGIIPFSNGLAGICQNGKWGYVDKDFNIVIPLKYDWVGRAGKHLMRVIQNDDKSHVVIESYINRRDSIVWQRVDNKKK